MADTRSVQQRLKKLGFYAGAIDGKSGPKTLAAIKTFQVATGLAADGKIGPVTSAELFPDSLNEVRDATLPTFPPSASTPAGWPKQKDCMKCYGGVGLHQTKLALPFTMRLAWDKAVKVNTITLHEKVHDSAARIFQRIADAYDESARKKLGLDLFGGSLNVRKMRGGSSYSMHSWGIAIDFDPERNQLKWGRDKARLGQADAEPFWRIFEDEGWISLGRARNYDWMHVQAAKL